MICKCDAKVAPQFVIPRYDKIVFAKVRQVASVGASFQVFADPESGR